MKQIFRKYIFIILVSIILNLPIFNAAAAQDNKIPTLKAITILNFANYIQVIKDNPQICIVDDNKIYSLVSKINESRKGKSKINLISNTSNINASQCSFVFISARNKGSLSSLINNKKIVTASDRSGFIDSGGLIELFEDEGRIKFAVNLKKAKLDKIQIDSRLIEAADRIE